jgi:MFS family permease
MSGKVFLGWRQVAAASVFQAVSMGANYSSFSILAIQLQEEFHPSRTLLMAAMTCAMLASALFKPVVGAAIDRYSLRLVVLTGILLISAGPLLVSFTQSMIQVVVIYGLFMGTSNALLGPVPASTLISRWFNRRRGLANGIAAVGISFGGLIFPQILQHLVEDFGWRAALRLFSAILLVVSVPVVIGFIVNRPSDRNLFPDGDSSAPPEQTVRTDTRTITTKEILADRNFWLLGIVFGIMFGCASTVLGSLAPIALEKGATASDGANLISAYAAAALGGILLFAAVSDHVALRASLIFAVLCAMSGALLFWSTQRLEILFLGSALFGLCGGFATPLWGLLVARVFGTDHMGRAMGMMGLLTSVFSISSPLLFGLAFDATNSYTIVLLTCGIVLAAALIPVSQIELRPRQTAA